MTTTSSSSYLDEAMEILDSVRGKPQSVAERKRLAIDLAAAMLREAARIMTPHEKAMQEQLSRLMADPIGKAFTTALTDQAFRSNSPRRVADQIIYLINQLGTPQYLDWLRKMQLVTFKTLGPAIAQFLVPIAIQTLRKETTNVILPGESAPLKKHLLQRRQEGVRINLNHLGEAILSEPEAKRRLHIYLEDLKNPDIDYISIKISTIFSQINLLSYDDSIEIITDRLKQLYRAAMSHPLNDKPKFVNLDMEEYRDLELTITSFCKILDEAEFQNFSAGIVLQAYVPDSFPFQKQLTEWAKHRVQNGGAPIKIRIVKGANLSMEQFEASLKGWPQAPYLSKMETDANFKRMVIYGSIPENARAVHLGIASHNLFDVAFAMLIRLENQIEPYVGFEMLEGMADHIRRVVQQLTGNMLLYCPIATHRDFQHAIAYLIRRLDENTGAENFLRHIFGLKPGSESWDSQTSLFSQSCDEIETTSTEPRRKQDRFSHPSTPDPHASFDNEPDTDFSLPQNRRWGQEIARHWKHLAISPVPLVINGEELQPNENGIGFSPSDPNQPLYRYAKATPELLKEAITAAKNEEKAWTATTVEHRSQLLACVAEKLRERRGELIGAMMMDGGKTISEADPEVSEAIDFAEYYRRQMGKMAAIKDIEWKPKGTILVTPPWNFPCSIPAGGVLAALMTGNCVLFKPASDTILVAWHLVNAFWDAGISKKVLQFVPCSGDESGSVLIQDPRVNCVVLTGGTSTAKKFLKLRPGIDLAAETGGKNAMIITALSDRDMAIKDLLQSAFGHAGQKCSATSLAILEAEVYEDAHFRRQLRDAAASLKIGPSWDLSTKINPLIHEAKDVLKRALTSLETGEEWLLEPKQSSENPNLWSPGIKIGVRPGSFTQQTELFGPVLGIMRADNLHHALELANSVAYGLTAGLQSLDDREQLLWIQEMEAGNLYINRTTTGAIVRRQPFGGCKASSFGSGSKAGGPNYLRELMMATQIDLPQGKHPVNEWVNSLTSFLDKIHLSAEQLGLWTASVANYSYWWKRLRHDQDPSKIVGQDNFFRYIPRKGLVLRLESHSNPFDALRVCAAALTCGAQLEISTSASDILDWGELASCFRVKEESEAEFLVRIKEGKMQRIRMVEEPSKKLLSQAAESAIHIVHAPVLANGRFELLHYLREVSISIDYHRYGNLGLREGELRKPII